eukprot:scaffold97956_cov42-Phaeocystis_antarctica.AAC.1
MQPQLVDAREGCQLLPLGVHVEDSSESHAHLGLQGGHCSPLQHCPGQEKRTSCALLHAHQQGRRGQVQGRVLRLLILALLILALIAALLALVLPGLAAGLAVVML